jgi:hypothetical protein
MCHALFFSLQIAQHPHKVTLAYSSEVILPSATSTAPTNLVFLFEESGAICVSNTYKK